MIEILIFFIGMSLWLYVLLGGPDFGAGILELLPAGKSREARKKLINQAMGPVWEANHMWLILVIVILFMGFPGIFVTLMVSLHLPMLALLVGIVIRGAAFTFRHYDAIEAPASQRVYTWLFGLSSLWTSFWLGIIAASLNRGVIDLTTRDTWDAYIRPWFGIYPAAVGVFVTCIFLFLACVYLIGETDDVDLRHGFTLRAVVCNCLVVLSGGLVFLASLAERKSLFTAFLEKPLTLLVMALATGLFAALWICIRHDRVFLTRVAAAGQASLILLGWMILYSPNAVTTLQKPLDFYQEAAPPATLWQLVLALLIGSVFIFPALFYLFRIFKLKSPT